MDICVIGCGSIGKRHIDNLIVYAEKQQIELRIDLLRSSSKKIDDRLNSYIAEQFFSIEDLKKKYDAIFITNPTFLHYQTIKDTTEMANYFFVEKPVFDRCDKWDIVEKLHKCDRIKNYYVACPLRYTQIIKDLKKFVVKKQVNSIRAICSSYLPDWRKGVDYRNTYSAHTKEGGGVRLDLIHELDYIVNIWGFPDNIMSISGHISSLQIDSDDCAIYIAKYDDRILEVHLDYFSKYEQRKIELICDDGMYTFDILNNVVYKNGVIIKKYVEQPNDKYIKELEAFLNILHGGDNCNDIAHAYEVLKLANC